MEMNLAIIDFVFIGIIALFALRCAIRGLLSELFSMAALVIGMLSAIFFFRRGAVFVRETFMPESAILPEIIAFAAIFIGIFIIIKILETILKNIIEGINLGGLDRLLGFVLGCAEGIIIVCLLLFLISVQPLFEPANLLGKSFFAEILLPFILGDPKKLLESIVKLKMPEPGGV